jgi:CspA family cold shock protein
MSVDRSLGKVKWFNSKAGYGFITAIEGEQEGKDIFAHYSELDMDDKQYKYLVQGEYIEFQLAKLDDGKYEYQATKITGVRGGDLLCKTRKLAQLEFNNSDNPRNSVPRKSDSSNEETYGYKNVVSNKQKKVKKTD